MQVTCLQLASLDICLDWSMMSGLPSFLENKPKTTSKQTKKKTNQQPIQKNPQTDKTQPQNKKQQTTTTKSQQLPPPYNVFLCSEMHVGIFLCCLWCLPKFEIHSNLNRGGEKKYIRWFHPFSRLSFSKSFFLIKKQYLVPRSTSFPQLCIVIKSVLWIFVEEIWNSFMRGLKRGS